MRYNLTAEEISSYRTDGFLIVDDFLNEDEVKLWKDTIDLAITKRQGRKFPHS